MQMRNNEGLNVLGVSAVSYGFVGMQHNTRRKCLTASCSDLVDFFMIEDGVKVFFII